MPYQVSVAVQNARLDAIESVTGPSAVLKLRSSNLPANAAASDAGVVAATVDLPADYLTDAAGGTKSKSGTWDDSEADNTALVQHFRFYEDDGVTCHQQGLVSMAWQPGHDVQVGHQMHNGGNLYRCTTAGTTAGSGGPSGTGAGISDGTAVWTWLEAGVGQMTVDNVEFVAGQQFTVTEFGLSDANG